MVDLVDPVSRSRHVIGLGDIALHDLKFSVSWPGRHTAAEDADVGTHVAAPDFLDHMAAAGRPPPEGLTDDPTELAAAARLHLREKLWLVALQ